MFSSDLTYLIRWRLLVSAQTPLPNCLRICADTIDNTLRTSGELRNSWSLKGGLNMNFSFGQRPSTLLLQPRYDDDAVDFTPSLESIRLRLGDVATCKYILEKMKIDMLSALERYISLLATCMRLSDSRPSNL